MTVFTENCEVRRIGDRGKPGTSTHAVELELRIPRRDAIRLVLPFILAAIIAPDASKPNSN
jgi:hypothetical protein